MTLSLLSAARRAPRQPAVVVDGQILDYRALADRVLRAVAWLVARRAEGPAALVATGELDTLVMVHTLIALGIPFIPLHPRLTPTERQQLIDHISPALVIDADWSEAACSLPPADADSIPDLADDERPLAILHTSGTSGQPKGVVLSRRAFAAAARASEANLGWQADDRWLLCLPLSHVGGLSIITRCLLGQRALVLLPRGMRLEASDLAGIIDRERVTLLSLVPTLLDRLLDLDDWQLPPHVRAILLGGAASSPRLLERAAARGLPVLTTYGLTEACSQVTTQRFGTTNTGQLGSGPPVAGVEVRIVDGIIEVRGDNLLSGYYPVGPEPLDAGGWLSTGDAGFLDEHGNLHVLGRRGDLIVTGGENVYPAEVEAALERCPGVREACVFGVDDDRWGQIVAAALSPEPGKSLDTRSLGAVLRARLAPFKRPRRVAVLDSLERGPSGKLDRRATAELAKNRLGPLEGGNSASRDAG